MLMTTEHIWEDFHAQLKHFILKRVPDEFVAEDILQEVFVKIHLHIQTLKDEQKLQGWLYQIARNAITDYYRREQRLVSMPVVPERGDWQDEELLPTTEDAEQALAPAVASFVAALPPLYRQAIVLTEYEGLTQRELADRLGISLSGAKSRVQRARDRLKDMLLDCCHVELDRRGHIIDYVPRRNCCVRCEEDGCP